MNIGTKSLVRIGQGAKLLARPKREQGPYFLGVTHYSYGEGLFSVISGAYSRFALH
jgi:hypothetical protein